MGRLSLLLLGAAATVAPTLAFLPPSSTPPLRSSSSHPPLASSYYDDYDAQGARNMEQDRCVCSWRGRSIDRTINATSPYRSPTP